MKRQFAYILFIIIMALALASCGTAPAQQEDISNISESSSSGLPLTLTDGLDNEVTFTEYPEKIISMAPSNTEILFAIGAGEQVIGKDFFSDYPAEAADLPIIGDMTGNNLEVIADLQPDLVLAAEINSPEDVQAIMDLGFTVYTLNNPKDLDGLYENLETVARITGHEEQADTLITSLKDRVKETLKIVEKAESAPRVFYELDATDPSKPWTVGQGTYHEQMIEMAGGENIGSMFETQYPQISQEELIIQNPEIIILSDAIWGITPEMVVERPGWDTMQAVQDNAIYPFDGNLLDRPGPRLVEGLEELALMLHPALFE